MHFVPGGQFKGCCQSRLAFAAGFDFDSEGRPLNASKRIRSDPHLRPILLAGECSEFTATPVLTLNTERKEGVRNCALLDGERVVRSRGAEVNLQMVSYLNITTLKYGRQGGNEMTPILWIFHFQASLC